MLKDRSKTSFMWVSPHRMSAWLSWWIWVRSSAGVHTWGSWILFFSGCGCLCQSLHGASSRTACESFPEKMHSKWLEREKTEKKSHEWFVVAKKIKRIYNQLCTKPTQYKVSNASEEYLTKLGHSVGTCSRTFTAIKWSEHGSMRRIKEMQPGNDPVELKKKERIKK